MESLFGKFSSEHFPGKVPWKAFLEMPMENNQEKILETFPGKCSRENNPGQFPGWFKMLLLFKYVVCVISTVLAITSNS